MGKQFSEIDDRQKEFIEGQKIFFVGTAMADGRVNVSPKGMDSLRVVGPKRVLWLNVTGSGNETAAHVLRNPRMTLMFAAFEGPPMILRLYGQAKAVHHNDIDWPELKHHFPDIPGARQIFDMTVDLVQSSCGMGVPYYNYTGERNQLDAWALKKGDEGLRAYWKEKNTVSLDGRPTQIEDKNL